MLLPVLYEIGGFILILLVCILHANLFNQNIKISSLFHGFWLSFYVAYIIVSYIFCHNWHLVFALVLLRAAAYNQVLNYIRHEPIFYVHADPKTGSVIDRQLAKAGIFYPVIWGLCVIEFIYIQFFL